MTRKLSNKSRTPNFLLSKHPEMSARGLSFFRLGRYLLVSLIILLLLYKLCPIAIGNSLILAINIFYFLTIVAKLSIFFLGYIVDKLQVKDCGYKNLKDSDLPIYSILVPLYNEGEKTVRNLIKAIQNIDYPKSKLDVKLIVEEDDSETQEVIQQVGITSQFEIIKVAYSLPRTKPKACDYALQFARGEYVTIYDAEDLPDPYQLKKAIAKFQTLNDKYICLQARLNYYNKNENLLTRMFSLEYSLWFVFLLKGLDVLGLPIPLGGTSNHFKIDKLREIGAWDAYNVTEDADIGIRLARLGYQVSTLDSVTLEESPISLGNWMRQRSRWIKGFMQTYFVHMRDVGKLYKDFGFKNFLGFQFFIGIPFFVFITLPLVMVLYLLKVLGILALQTSHSVNYFSLINFISITVFMVVFIFLMVFERNVEYKYSFVKEQKINKYFIFISDLILFPFYWLLHSLASFKALWQLVKKPYYWEKTRHGQSKYID